MSIITLIKKFQKNFVVILDITIGTWYDFVVS